MTTPSRIVLVVDDEPHVLRLLSATLGEAGYDVLQACDGREAVELFQRHPSIAAIVIDLVMPVMEGLETIRALRVLSASVLIVAMSGAFEGRFLGTARALGADCELPKPFEAAALRAALASLERPPNPRR